MIRCIMIEPTKELILLARTKAVHTQTQAAAVLYKGVRTWQKWENGERQMDAALFELYLIKTKQKSID